MTNVEVGPTFFVGLTCYFVFCFCSGGIEGIDWSVEDTLQKTCVDACWFIFIIY